MIEKGINGKGQKNVIVKGWDEFVYAQNKGYNILNGYEAATAATDEELKKIGWVSTPEAEAYEREYFIKLLVIEKQIKELREQKKMLTYEYKEKRVDTKKISTAFAEMKRMAKRNKADIEAAKDFMYKMAKDKEVRVHIDEVVDFREQTEEEIKQFGYYDSLDPEAVWDTQLGKKIEFDSNGNRILNADEKEILRLNHDKKVYAYAYACCKYSFDIEKYEEEGITDDLKKDIRKVIELHKSGKINFFDIPKDIDDKFIANSTLPDKAREICALYKNSLIEIIEHKIIKYKSKYEKDERRQNFLDSLPPRVVDVRDRSNHWTRFKGYQTTLEHIKENYTKEEWIKAFEEAHTEIKQPQWNPYNYQYKFEIENWDEPYDIFMEYHDNPEMLYNPVRDISGKIIVQNFFGDIKHITDEELPEWVAKNCKPYRELVDDPDFYDRVIKLDQDEEEALKKKCNGFAWWEDDRWEPYTKLNARQEEYGRVWEVYNRGWLSMMDPKTARHLRDVKAQDMWDDDRYENYSEDEFTPYSIYNKWHYDLAGEEHNRLGNFPPEEYDAIFYQMSDEELDLWEYFMGDQLAESYKKEIARRRGAKAGDPECIKQQRDWETNGEVENLHAREPYNI